MTDVFIVFVTVGSEEEAAGIGRTVVEEKLAACANLVPGLRSIYAWKGEIHDEREILVVMKTKAALFTALQERIKELHSYEVPEIIGFPIAQGFQPYLDWVRENTLP